MRSAQPGCVVPTLAAGGALAGGYFDLDISEGESSCISQNKTIF